MVKLDEYIYLTCSNTIYFTAHIWGTSPVSDEKGSLNPQLSWEAEGISKSSSTGGFLSKHNIIHEMWLLSVNLWTNIDLRCTRKDVIAQSKQPRTPQRDPQCTQQENGSVHACEKNYPRPRTGPSERIRENSAPPPPIMSILNSHSGKCHSQCTG